MTNPNQTAGTASTPATSPSQPTTSPAPAGTPKRILFVETDASGRQQLEPLLVPLRRQWEVTLVENAGQALELMTKVSFNAVVSALNLGATTGVTLLNDAFQRDSKITRFVRCPAQERKRIKDFTGSPPHHLSTELDADGLAAAIKRALRIEEWLGAEALKKLVTQMRKLPALPDLYSQVVTELQSPNGSMETVAKAIAQDPVMSAKMLQLVNSAFFGLSSEITEPMEAVMYLGGERIKSLILMTSLFCQYDKAQCQGFDPEGLCRHLLAVGASAKTITWSETKDAKMSDVAFTAGLLHDIGKLMLAANLPDVYSSLLVQAKNRSFPIRGLEMVTLGATHAELGACLLATWGLPLSILDALAWHHTPILSDDPAFTVLTAVHAANVIEHEKTGAGTTAPVLHMDAAHLGRLGLGGRRNRWRQLCGATPRIQDEDATERMGAPRA